jgi:N,N'-diacetyllegionaminate synthase
MELIAEFCQNHNGDFGLLKEMVYAAKESGCTYGKIQSISPDMVTFRERFEKGIIKNGKQISIQRPFQAEVDRMSKLEITLDEQADFVQLCNKVGLKPLTTAFSRSSVEKIKEVGFKDIKIASYDCASVPLLQDAANIFDRIIVSTGATFDREIELAAHVLKGYDFSFLHCVTMYPTPLHEFNLARMKFLSKYTDSIGWSDHSKIALDGIKGTLAAVYFGAKLIERHFTILDESETKDGPVSIDSKQAQQIVEASKMEKSDLKGYLEEVFPNYKTTLGTENRDLSDEELLNRDYFRGRFGSPLADGSHQFNWD